MKKLFICVAVISAFSFASCKKDHTCTCTSTSTIPGSTANTQVTTIIDAKKGDAKKMCIDRTSTYTSGGVSYTSTFTCELK